MYRINISPNQYILRVCYFNSGTTNYLYIPEEDMPAEGFSFNIRMISEDLSYNNDIGNIVSHSSGNSISIYNFSGLGNRCFFPSNNYYDINVYSFANPNVVDRNLIIEFEYIVGTIPSFDYEVGDGVVEAVGVVVGDRIDVPKVPPDSSDPISKII